MILLFKYECGCIGFARDPETQQALVVDVCDAGQDDPIGLGWRNMEDRSVTPLDELAQENVLNTLRRRLNYGVRFMDIKSALDVEVKR